MTKQENERQLIPKLPRNILISKKQEKDQKSKIDAKFLAAKKMQRIYESINQTLNGLSDDWILKKYYNYLKMNNIQI